MAEGHAKPANSADLPPGFKMTELGPLPEEWEVAEVGDLFDMRQGKSLSPRSRRGISPVPFLRTANVLWGRLDLAHVDRMDFSEQEVQAYALEPMDLLVCEGGDVGRTALWTGALGVCCYQNHLHRLRCKDGDVWPPFYMYWMQAAILLLGLYLGAENRSTIPNLSQARLKAFLVPKPPLPEQRKIAAVLNIIRRAIEATDKVIAATRELKKSLMRHLFTYGPVPYDQADQVPLKETEIGPLPEGWEVVPLKQLVVKTSQVDPRRRPGWRFTYVDVSGVSSRSLRIEGFASCIGQEAPSRARKVIKAGDVIFATVRPYLRRVAVVPAELDDQICSTAFCVIRANPGAASAGFLFHAVSSDAFVTRVSGHQHGSSYPAVTDRQVLSEKMPCPPVEEQGSIAETLSDADRRILAEESRKSALESLFKTMLHLLMTGQVRVKDWDIAEATEGSAP